MRGDVTHVCLFVSFPWGVRAEGGMLFMFVSLLAFCLLCLILVMCLFRCGGGVVGGGMLFMFVVCLFVFVIYVYIYCGFAKTTVMETA